MSLKKYLTVFVVLLFVLSGTALAEQKQTSAEYIQEQLNYYLDKLTPTQHSALQERLKDEEKVSKSGYGISFYRPTYVLPYYYTASPANAIYGSSTPDNQSIKNSEFKAQLSLGFPIWYHILKSNYSLMGTYTQLSYWQFYAKSQYFRETDYEPELFIQTNFKKNWLASAGVVHESNGRGGDFERSWNRAFIDIEFSGEHWMISMRPWILIFKEASSDLHNPDIRKYLGNGRTVVAYKFNNTMELSFMFRNMVESGFKRGAYELDFAFPIHAKVSGFVQLFSGYGQSLIEYNHRTNAVGVGMSLSNWI